MTYEVLVKKAKGKFTATILSLRNCKGEGETRDEAIAKARDAAESLIAEGEVVQIQVADGRQSRGIARFAGVWTDDSTFDAFSSAMQEHRRSVDGDPSQP